MLASGILLEFAQFLRIISWITFPVLFLAVIITIIIHYYRKKKRKNGEEPLTEEGVHLLFDHTGLIRQYHTKLSYNQARYAALKQDFEKLELKYAALNTNNEIHMENTVNNLQTGIDMLSETHALEKKELESCIEQLRNENENLRTQVQLNGEQQYLQDLLEVKNNQILFLQEQVEKQVKSFHVAERGRHDLENQVTYLSSVIKELTQQNEMLNASVGDNQDRIDQLNEELAKETDRVSQAENKLQANLQALKKIQRTLADCVGEELEGPQVIEMKTNYTLAVESSE
jgi:chromosome segregation ATPase